MKDIVLADDRVLTGSLQFARVDFIEQPKRARPRHQEEYKAMILSKDVKSKLTEPRKNVSVMHRFYPILTVTRWSSGIISESENWLKQLVSQRKTLRRNYVHASET